MRTSRYSHRPRPSLEESTAQNVTRPGGGAPTSSMGFRLYWSRATPQRFEPINAPPRLLQRLRAPNSLFITRRARGAISTGS